MKRYKDYFDITIVISLLGLVALLAANGWLLVQIRHIIQKQFEYQVEMQFCGQESLEYLAPCRLEMDIDGSYHWYFNPNEGRK